MQIAALVEVVTSFVICKADDRRSQWTCSVKVMFGSLDVRNRQNPMFFRAKWLPASMGGTDGSDLHGFDLGRVLHCKVEFRCADRTVMAASCVGL